MKKIAVTVLIAMLLPAASALALETPGLSDKQRAYVAEITAERQAADLEMRDDHWSPLALTNLTLLHAATVSIGSAARDSVVLQGPTVQAHHAEVIAVSSGGGLRHKIRAVAGPLFIESNAGEEISELLLEPGGPRLRIGRNIVYYQDSNSLGPMIRVLDFESPAYTLFEGLDYFPIDPAYRVEATIKPYEQPEPIKIVDTMGFISPAWVYGMAEFTLRGEPSRLKLVLFTPEPTPESIFYVMYGDKTNGRETYGAGRYLLPEFVPSGKITLDFNRSVNPSCAYNSGFACPMPPSGNRFAFAVPAGIRDYAHRPPR
ncbi:MAG: DUF1684 domain-containing protein [Gammaproteobacteria bacterium]|nr:MAG: DUF1684 domain-containing protein [Gammaproteobacteria bacterium]